MACGVRCSKGLKICCGVTVILLIILVVVLVVLFLTVFKPKDPDIVLQSVKLEGFELDIPTAELNVPLGIVVTVENPNHGSFTYQKSTAYLYYRGTLVAEAPLHEDTIPARKDHNISTSLTIFADVTKLFQDLLSDYFRGVINFTSTTTLLGKVKVLDVLKMKATSYSTCDLSLFIHDRSINSTCNTKIKL
ncbi:Late embryogenesis abundant protein, LEA-14 [Spatholobus suberectus]|nr:Late embryogenesis abundant protein, LEA-14 [Spatholobus suberectus]